MLLFASDLDQTLIYSKRFVSRPELETRAVERLEGEEISFMTESCIKKLEAFSGNNIFVPVTTRTIEQYQRVEIFSNVIKPRYAITSNGGNILIGGKPCISWNDRIVKNISSKCEDENVILKEFLKIANDQWILKHRDAEGLFKYFITVPELLPADELESFKRWLENTGWEMSLQGRKLYLIPGCINKRDALAFIREMSGAEKTAAAGDSNLDLCMMLAADYAITPAHGHLAGLEGLEKKIHVTHSSGITASDDILDYIDSLTFL